MIAGTLQPYRKRPLNIGPVLAWKDCQGGRSHDSGLGQGWGFFWRVFGDLRVLGWCRAALRFGGFKILGLGFRVAAKAQGRQSRLARR